MKQSDANIDANLNRAVEVFARGFSFTRSLNHPYEIHRLAGLWRLADGPRRGKQPTRTEEWITHSLHPTDIAERAGRLACGRFAICHIVGIAGNEAATKEQYKAAGFRLNTTEALMVHRLKRVLRPQSPATIHRVSTQELADRIASANGSRQILPEHLEARARPPLRQYAALTNEDTLAGWVRSVVVDDATWCSNMYVEPPHRRRGIASAMMCHMLRDDRAAGAKSAYLLASHTGAKLYTGMGYEHIGTLLVFTLLKR